jgi:hypothetical protein
MGILGFHEITCDNPLCGNSSCYHTDSLGRAIDYARADGWAVGRGHKHCYCPKCAPNYRSVGRYSVQSRYGRSKYPPPETPD